MKLIIISPRGVTFNRQVEKVSVANHKETFTVLPDHAPFMSALYAGKLKYNTKEHPEEQELQIDNGLIEVRQNNIWIYTQP